MSLFYQSTQKPLKLKVKHDRVRDIKRGYPWIFKHSLLELPEAAPGTFALLRSPDNEIIAKGMYDPSCQLAFRVCALSETLNDELIDAKISKAIQIRASIISTDTNAYRVINGEGDGLPGLVCDRFGGTAVIQLDGVAPTGFWNINEIAQLIAAKLEVKQVYFKPRGDSKESGRALLGAVPKQEVQFIENGCKYGADIVNGQKSGFFLDQRENRRKIATLSKGAVVLNLFGYTGGFSIAAGMGGAKHVTTVDIAKPAIESANANWLLNNLSPQSHDGRASDCYEYLKQIKGKKRFDIVVADPPSFAPSKAALDNAREAYVNLFSECIHVTDKGGILAASSCSSHVSPALFMDILEDAVSKAKRRATVLGVYGQPLDHPFPLVCTELQYLKFVLLQMT